MDNKEEKTNVANKEDLGLDTSISYALRSGNTVEPLICGDEFYLSLQEAFSKAESSIWLGLSFASWNFRLPNKRLWWEYLISLKKQKPNLSIKTLIWRNDINRWGDAIFGTKRDWDYYISKHKLYQFIDFKWDDSPTLAHCHHCKYYIIDAELDPKKQGQELQNAGVDTSSICGYIGGMVLTPNTYDDVWHDTFVKIQGPAVIDIAENFKLRWNNSYYNPNLTKTCPNVAYDNIIKIKGGNYKKDTMIGNLKLNDILSAQSGDGDGDGDGDKDNDNDGGSGAVNDSTNESKDDTKSNKDDNIVNGVNVQIAWTCYPDIYPNYKLGESSIHYYYCHMINSAKSSVYIESQHPGEYKILSLLYKKLKENKNFKVIYIAPINMMYPIRKCKQESIEYENILLTKSSNNNKQNKGIPEKPRYFDTFDMLSKLSQEFSDFESIKANSSQFMLCGLSSKYKRSIYVHSKLCIIDGNWFTIGSANMVDISMIKDHTEINACVWNEKESMKLLKRLANKHIGLPFLRDDIDKIKHEQDEKISGFFGVNKATGQQYNDQQIVSKLIDIAASNRYARLNTQNTGKLSVVGHLVALDSSVYATHDMEITQ